MKHILLPVIMLLIIGCGNDKDRNNVPDMGKITMPEGILPLKIGNQWVYELHALDTTSNRMRPFKIDTFRVTHDTLIDDSLWFVLAGLGENGTMARNNNDGLWFARKGQSPFLFAKYPAVMGDKYVKLGDSDTLSTEVTATGIKMLVPAGSFTGYQYTQIADPPHAVYNYYFAPGVGLIKMDILDREGKKPLVFAVLREMLTN